MYLSYLKQTIKNQGYIFNKAINVSFKFKRTLNKSRQGSDKYIR